jgi:hypothetical protein
MVMWQASRPRPYKWGEVAEQGDAGSPGSGGASPYLRRGFPLDLGREVTLKNSGFAKDCAGRAHSSL